ncbi:MULTISPECIES: hypothetical protein [Niastella]|uniref:DUF4595 domain-containing protein n=1 Tax=Niastella soli TaxID=2821487 RepID=A0ABS3YSA8_9BACT|nr:hypothetical protein [Niastella soli]MBO9200765.1 hypothetical protein [Niastella soli]
MQKNILYAFVLLFFIVSCNDKDSPIDPVEQTDKCRLIKMIQGTHNGAEADTTFTFFYNTAGKVEKVTEYNPYYNTKDTFLLAYNDAGRLVSVNARYRANYFKYNSNGTLAEAIATGGLTDTTRFRYEYAGSILPQKSICYQHDLVNKTWDTTEYRYVWQNGNVVSREQFSKGVSVIITGYQYDTIPNVAPDLLLMGFHYTIPIGYYEEFLYFNKNVVRKESTRYAASQYTYQTDSGRIVKSIESYLRPPYNTDTTTGYTRNYFYECK